MTIRNLLVYLLFLPFLAFAQGDFEAGYLIDSTGVRRSVLIKNSDWRYNPDHITVQTGNTTEEELVTASLREFGIPGKARFVNFTLPAETTSILLGNLPGQPPRLAERKLLLRVEVIGPATLYGYYRPQVTKYFLRMPNEEIPTQLIYARWRSGAGEVAQSERFITQLNQALNCDQRPVADRNTDYTLRSLRNIVLEYSECRGEASEVFTNNAAREKRFRLNIASGIYRTRFEMVMASNQRQLFETEGQFVFRPGLELEYFLPFGNNRVSLLFSPSYYRLEGGGEYSEIAAPTRATVEYAILDLPIGARYRILQHREVSLFATALLGYGLTLSGEVEPDRGPPIEQTGTFNLNGGLGLQYRSIGLEARYQRDGDFLPAGGFQSNTGGVRVLAYYSF